MNLPKLWVGVKAIEMEKNLQSLQRLILFIEIFADVKVSILDLHPGAQITPLFKMSVYDVKNASSVNRFQMKMLNKKSNLFLGIPLSLQTLSLNLIFK